MLDVVGSGAAPLIILTMAKMAAKSAACASEKAATLMNETVLERNPINVSMTSINELMI